MLHVSGDSRASSLLPILPAHLEVAEYFQTVARERVPVRRLDSILNEIAGPTRGSF